MKKFPVKDVVTILKISGNLIESIHMLGKYVVRKETVFRYNFLESPINPLVGDSEDVFCVDKKNKYRLSKNTLDKYKYGNYICIYNFQQWIH